jgi:signal peptidase I
VAGTVLILIGRIAVVATNGISMIPAYHQGDLVVVQRRDTYRPGEIVAYRRPDKDLVVLHRIIGGGPTGYVFKGDNNASVDPTRPTQDLLIGRAVLHIPEGGIWLRRLTSPALLAALAVLVVMGGRRVAASTRRERRKAARTVPRRHNRPPNALRPALHGLAVGAALLAISGLAVSALAWTRPAAHRVSSTSSDPSTMTFSYAASVAPSAAYDTTTVTSPQAVFRRLVRALDVTYEYGGRPGRLSVSALLETSSGWSTRLPLDSRAVGPSHRGTVRLDLPALERRAAAAARVIGLPTGLVTVAVVTDLHFDAGGSFAPRLELVLDALVVKSRGALSARSPLEVVTSRQEPAHLSVMGQSFHVTTGRTAGGAAIGLGLLVAMLLGIVRRLVGPAEEADRIHARYRDLILPVMPFALDERRALVEVPDIASLARLADRQGLLILHWSRDGRHTFVVEDEGTTFLCRRPSTAPDGRADIARRAQSRTTGPAVGAPASSNSCSAGVGRPNNQP